MPVMLDCQDSYEYLAEQINKIRPGFIATYTSPIKLIAEKMAELGYRVPVKIILCSGEDLTELDRCEIQKGFPEAEIHSVYACSEASTIATECRYGHLHINEDTVKIEAVDNDFNVLPYGVKSDQALITVYGNKVQPVIRYVVGDRITLHKSDCPCGCRFDWLEIQGRTSDIVYFDGKNGEKTGVSPLTLMINMDRFYSNGVENFNDYQIIVHPENKIELRLAFIEPCNHKEVFDAVKKGIIDYLKSLEIEVGEVYLSDVPPVVPEPGVKKRRVYNVNK